MTAAPVAAVLLGLLALQGACSHGGKTARPGGPEIPSAQGPADAARLEGYEELLALLEQRRHAEARSRLEAGARARAEQSASCPVAFDLAAAILAEKTDLDGLKAFRETFSRYADRLPRESAGRSTAERMVRLLDERIREVRGTVKRNQALTRRLAEQERALEDLEYKLRKLEEIQQETETKREDFLHK